ncbi:hypothetical protein M9M90_01100 [Phenylobacterium sp. LH3H17]|uniref:hypothetical protein n=1 Tax=Phenylobacterium sp. LH3H17 TaxID=2903901 RepID=UPI0020C990AB|nr:hypothetical protein [Phenylobacterium sp. LH3H17]UTP39802.1 hypothetical protein M9M90_01100 [Phenylobacterium sp. LH3H17]
MDNLLQQAAHDLSVTVPGFTGGKAFEGLVLFKLAIELRNLGNPVEALSHKGNPTLTFRLRGGPGHIPSPTQSGLYPSYFRIGTPSFLTELHNSVEFTGFSGGDHEIDIAAVRSADVDAVRAKGGGQLEMPPIVGAELKRYASSATLDKNFIRALLGWIVDLLPLWTFDLVVLKGLRAWSGASKTSAFWFLTTGQLSDEAKGFGRHYSLHVEDGVTAANLTPLVAEMATFVEMA